MDTTLTTLQKRNSNLDLLRIIACVFVILVHTSSNLVYMTISDSGWKLIHIYNSFAHSGNVLFLMISGSLLLSEDYRFNPKKFYSRNFVRLLTSYFCWLIIFNIIGVIRYVFINHGGFSAAVALDAVKNVIRGLASYQFWFIPMLLGLYLLLPMLRAICHAERYLAPYFTVLFFITYILFNTILFFDFPHKYLFESLMTRIPFTLINDYAGYFVTGYLLTRLLKENKIPRPKITSVFLIVGGVLISLCGDLLLAAQQGAENSTAMNQLFSLCPCIIGAGFFILINSVRLPESSGLSSTLAALSGLTFGIYMIHPLLLSPVRMLTERFRLSAALTITLDTVLLFVVCCLVTWLLSLIPPVKKWILFIGRK